MAKIMLTGKLHCIFEKKILSFCLIMEITTVYPDRDKRTSIDLISVKQFNY